jgi:hypothetical protein
VSVYLFRPRLLDVPLLTSILLFSLSPSPFPAHSSRALFLQCRS